MTWNSHASVGAAQAVFYLPALIAAAYLAIGKHGSPRMPWIAITIFSIVRIIGGIILIIFEQHRQSVAWVIVGLIFQGTGVIPLIISTLGLFKIIEAVDFPDSIRFAQRVKLVRIVFMIGVALLVAGSSLQGVYTQPNLTQLGTKLAKAGYIIFAVIVGGYLAGDIFFWSRRKNLSRNYSLKIIVATTASIPFLAVRITYACLTTFSGNPTNPKWSPLFGSVVALVVMHSLMEYAVVVMYLTLGFVLPPVGKFERVNDSGGLGDTEDTELGK